MKPSLARAADELQTAGVKNVVIGIMDATENDAPAAYKAKGFPTIHFFPASREAKGEEYEGERNSKAFIDYLVRNAVNKFAFDTSKLGDDPKAKDEEEEEEAEVARDDDHDVDANDEDGEGEEAEENIDEGHAEEAEVEDVEKDEL
jgi:Thioredoxin